MSIVSQITDDPSHLQQRSGLERQVLAEQVQQLYKAFPASILANFVASLLILGIQWTAVIDDGLGRGWMISWFVVSMLVVFYRAILYLMYRKTTLIQNYDSWGNAFIAGAALNGLLWGAAGIILFPGGNELYQVTLVFCLLGMSAGSVSSHSFISAAPYSFVVLTLSPVFIRFLFEGTNLAFLLAAVMVLCMIYLLAAATRNSESNANNIRQRLTAIEKEREVERSRREAERANQAKSDFLSSMSHELRTPLNAIVGFGQLLEESDLAEQDRESVKHILRAGRHLTDMINDILDISRIESGNYGFSPEPVRLKKLLDDAWALVRPLAEERSIKLRDEISEKCNRYIFVDLQRFKQVILNILSNAIKYNRVAGHIRLYCEAREQDRIRISIEDSGCGIAEEDHLLVFEPFERLNADRMNIEGTGIGLALCRTLIHAMHGRIGLQSTPDHGSTFWVEFPVLHHYSEQATSVPQGELPVIEIQSDHPATILYIEDNMANLKLLESVMKQRKVKFIPAMQGELGFDLARKNTPDLILLDLHLPDINGDVVLQRLRQDPHTSTIPVIIISADATQQQIDSLLAMGAFAYLTKPFDIRQLIQTINRALAG